MNTTVATFRHALDSGHSPEIPLLFVQAVSSPDGTKCPRNVPVVVSVSDSDKLLQGSSCENSELRKMCGPNFSGTFSVLKIPFVYVEV